MQIASFGVRLLILQRMNQYAFVATLISAGFSNQLRFTMKLSGKAIVKS